ncbi:thioredoxin [Paenibacillus cellulosilyticus]|uniref:Thioredoxin n=1 Tax=Paenibacillus cellulosilyticus TaxID=375489 RepID=A0A2V2YL07_9BACL|nr:thioredoxin family protein [Paenibacillus cellulosilyticus]PWV93828.1 thioredoxin [Paenibacillus cellulosilyticus]QKS47441.1 thioredoxin family protein [Paenibacillus cellulosilyticus]
MIRTIESLHHFKEVTSGSALVEFGDSNSFVCNELDCVLQELSEDTGFPIYKVNVDLLPEVAQELRIVEVPVTFVYKAGKLSSGFIGVRSAEMIRSQHLYA